MNLHFKLYSKLSWCLRPTHLNYGMFYNIVYSDFFFQEGESKKHDKKSEDEEPLSREKFEEIQEKVMKFITYVST